MLKKFRFQLLATYLLFTLLLVFSFQLNQNYFKRSERLVSVIEEIKNIHLLFLEDQKAFHTFLNYEIKDKDFYLKGQSHYTSIHHNIYWKITNRLDSLAKTDEFKKFGKINDTHDILALMDEYNAVIIKLIFKIRAIGTEGAGLEGEIEYNSSNLADIIDINRHIYNLRIAEKNYFIKNDSTYLKDLHREAFTIKRNLKKDDKQKQIHNAALDFLENYVTAFDSLVSMENAIGLSSNTGLKKKTDILANEIASKFISLKDEAIVYKSSLEKKLFIYYLALFLLLIFVGIMLSISLSGKQTKRISLLSENIGYFIKSEFSDADKYELKSSNDELGGLIRNFKILQKEIMTLIFGFKEKVAERTAEIYAQKLKIEQQNDELIETNRAYARFVPHEFMKFLNKQNIIELKLGDSVQYEMTILFSDIRSFTSISEMMSPKENFEFINAYLSKIGPIIRHNNGFIDKYIGDAIMALFPQNPEDAVICALQMQEALKEFNREQIEKGLFGIKVGTGIHTGLLMMGPIGEHERMDSSVIGDSVNLASRLENRTKTYGAEIIISEYMLSKINVPEKYAIRFLDNIKLKGKSSLTSIYEIISDINQQEKTLKLNYQPKYAEAVRKFYDADYQDALVIFKELNKLNPADIAVQYFVAKSIDNIKLKEVNRVGKFSIN
jgi:adenylate cyclase